MVFVDNFMLESAFTVIPDPRCAGIDLTFVTNLGALADVLEGDTTSTFLIVGLHAAFSVNTSTEAYGLIRLAHTCERLAREGRGPAELFNFLNYSDAKTFPWAEWVNTCVAWVNTRYS